MSEPVIQRWAAFADDPSGGNPAGVVLDAEPLTEPQMQRIAAEVGYAETAFVTGTGRRRGIRYFSPVAEVPFCGHATLAAAIALAESVGDGPLTFEAGVGPVEITVDSDGTDRRASFTSVPPRVEPLADAATQAVLDLIGLGRADLDPALPPRLVFAGNRHPLVSVADTSAFDSFSFDPAAARELIDAAAWPATIIVLHRPDADRWEARNIFPVGTITEDPATGAAAAAIGAYLRELGIVRPPAKILIEQGRHVGRPSVLAVAIPEAGGVTVSGSAVPIDGGA